MEGKGADTLFERSFEKLGLRYATYIGDGNGNAYSSVWTIKIYRQRRLRFVCSKKDGFRT